MEIVGLVVSGVIALIFGCAIIVSQPKLTLARYFFLTTVGVSAWSLGIAAFLSLQQADPSLVFVQLYYIAAALIAVSMLSVAIVVHKNRLQVLLVLSWLLFAILAGAIIVLPQTMFEGVSIGNPNTVSLQQTGYAVYSAYFLILFLATVVILNRHPRTTNRKNERTQARWLLYAYGPAGFVGAFFNLLLPALGSYELIWAGPLSVVIFVPFAYITIARHGLFDLRNAAVRTIAYVMSLTVLGLAYYIVAYGLSIAISRLGVGEGGAPGPVSIALALIIAFAFQPVRRFFDQLTNRIFYRGEYNREAFSREFGRILAYDTDLRLLLQEVSSHLASHLKAEHVFFYISGRGIMGSRGTRKARLPAEDVEQIAEYYAQYHSAPEVISADAVQTEAMQRLLSSHRSDLVLPLTLHRQTVGYVFIGEHMSRGYTVRDIRLLESIANELTIAVQNSLSVEEIRELNETLQRRIDDATSELRLSNRQLQRLDEAKDEFISMASHQLRTPLTSIKGYLDMMLQGDLGKVTATQRAVLSEAFISSERMVTLINDFLNVSRLQTGKFTIERRESDLAEAMQEQLQMLEVVAKQHDLTLRSKIDKNLPKVAVDIDKIRQVMLNMIDNAIFYSKPGTTVNISLAKEGDVVAFRVRDTGIGVPVAEQPGLFSKFFRATNARKKRPDGTGVGLFLAKKVILAHGGQVLFESKEGKGSTFGFTVPLA